MYTPPPRPKPSLYFDYPTFDFVRPPELDGERPRRQVAIVGGGPVGLTCAIELARHGSQVVVIENDATVADGSRAVCIARRSMEILQHVGVAERFLDKALVWTGGRSFYRNRVVFELEMPHGPDSRYHPMTNLQQCYIEQFLIEHIDGFDGIEIRWQSQVVGVAQTEDGARIRIDTPEGRYELEADYVIAADGARSTMRELMGLKLSGTSYSGKYLIADIKMASPHRIERRAWFDPPANPGSTVLMHKQPDDIWRVDYQLLDDDNEAEELREDRIRERIQMQLDMIGETTPWELDWYSLYKAHCLCLDDYRQGRVLFVGDAAHLVPIFGVRGLNSGLADANNLGWKLAYVLKGWAPADLLDTYGHERREATQEIFREAGKSTAFMTPPTRGYRLMRDAALSLALSETWPRGLINPRQSQPYDYTDSRLNGTPADDATFSAGPRVGAPLLNMRLPATGDGANAPTFLLDRLGLGFTLICFCDEALAPDIAETMHRLRVGDEPVTTIVVARQALTVDGAQVIADPKGRFFDTYGASAGSAYLARPDAHVCARWPRATGAAIEAALATAVMRNET